MKSVKSKSKILLATLVSISAFASATDAPENKTNRQRLVLIEEQLSHLQARADENQAMLKTLLSMSATSQVVAEPPGRIEADGPVARCARGLSSEAEAALRVLDDPEQRNLLSVEQAEQLKAVSVSCGDVELLCKDDPDKTGCSEKVDREKKRLAALLRIVALIFILNGDWKTGLMLLSLANGMDGDGGRQGGGVIGSDRSPTPSEEPPCRWCDDKSGLRMTEDGDMVTVYFESGAKTFNLGRIVQPSGVPHALDYRRDKVTAGNDTLIVTYCGDAVGRDGRFGSYSTYEILPVSGSASESKIKPNTHQHVVIGEGGEVAACNSRTR